MQGSTATMPPNGLYLITNAEPWVTLWPKLQLCLQSGIVRLMQYRRKQLCVSDQMLEISQLITLCNVCNVPLIINDNVVLAEHFSCGVHLGQTDGNIAIARKNLGNNAIIGATCHSSLLLAKTALQQGASYVAFGAVYASSSKVVTHTVSLAQVQSFVTELKSHHTKVCAIGGITVDNVNSVINTGVNYFAVIDGVLGKPLCGLNSVLNKIKTNIL